MEAELRTQIREHVLDQGLTLGQTLEIYSDLDPWFVRTVYANTKRDQVHIRHDESARPLSPVFSKKGIEAMNAGWLRPIEMKFDALPDEGLLFDTEGTTYLVGADIHEPDSDPHAMDIFYQIGRALRTKEIIINGDWFDCTSLSRFTPTAERHLRWVEERNEALKGVVKMRQNFPKSRIRFLPGNHDIRPLNWVDSNATPLQGLFTLEQYLGIDDPKLGIEVVNDGTIKLANGSLIIKHGTSVAGVGAASVRKEVDKAGCSVIMGHVHRRAIMEVTKSREVHTGVELGCLCSLKPHYGSKEDVVNWQQGFAVVTEYADGEFEVELVRIRDGKATFRGRRFQSRLLNFAA